MGRVGRCDVGTLSQPAPAIGNPGEMPLPRWRLPSSLFQRGAHGAGAVKFGLLYPTRTDGEPGESADIVRDSPRGNFHCAPSLHAPSWLHLSGLRAQRYAYGRGCCVPEANWPRSALQRLDVADRLALRWSARGSGATILEVHFIRG
jgi:hypothetical protein